MMRRATKADAPALLALLRRAYGARTAGEPPLRDTLADVERAIEEDDVYVLEEGGRLVATASLRPLANVRRVAVDPDAQRSGLGARVLEEVVARACEEGYSHATLDTMEGHPWLVGFYARHGFEERGTLTLRDGTRWRTMRRPLRE